MNEDVTGTQNAEHRTPNVEVMDEEIRLDSQGYVFRLRVGTLLIVF